MVLRLQKSAEPSRSGVPVTQKSLMDAVLCTALQLSSSKWDNRTDQTCHEDDLKQSISDTHILFISGAVMFLIGRVFPFLVVHKTMEHLKQVTPLIIEM